MGADAWTKGRGAMVTPIAAMGLMNIIALLLHQVSVMPLKIVVHLFFLRENVLCSLDCIALRRCV